MTTEEDVKVVAGRLRLWSEALAGLSEPKACLQLLTVLNEGDGDGLHKLMERWGLPGEVTCIEIVDTITRFVHTGDYQPVERCDVVPILRPPHPSTTSGRGYRLPDGRILWLTEAEWWDLYDKAADEAWRKANHDLLVALGIVTCTFELVATIERFDIDKRYTICTGGIDPFA
jgi:hypothetical protein